jgi:hypothetical protein
MVGTGSPNTSAGSTTHAAASDGAAGCPDAGTGCLGGEGMCFGDGACPASRVGIARWRVGFGNKLMIGRLVTSVVSAAHACRPPPDGFCDVVAAYDDPVLGLPFHIDPRMAAGAAHSAFHELVSAMLTLDSTACVPSEAQSADRLDRASRCEMGHALAVRLARRAGHAGHALARPFDWPALYDWLFAHAQLLVQGRSLRLLCWCWDESAPQTAPPRVCHAQTLLYGLDVLAQMLSRDRQPQLGVHHATPPIAQVCSHSP